MAAAKSADWENLDIAHAIGLSTLDMKRREPQLSACGYFWSDALNAFIFGHGPQQITLLDVDQLTGLDITSSVNPCGMKIVPTHRFGTAKGLGGWRKYMVEFNKEEGPVNNREHAAFLNMWLDRFLFCDPTMGPTDNFQYLAEGLVEKRRFPLGRFLLGATYDLLHNVAFRLRRNESVKNVQGPWWLVQLWLNVYFMKLIRLPKLTEFRCKRIGEAVPGAEVDDGQRRCTSFGEAMASISGVANSADQLADWFESFYQGLPADKFLWFPYAQEHEFEHPFKLDLEAPFANDISKTMYKAIISPSILPIGISSARGNHISYEFYHPVLSARQLGLAQLPPHFTFIGQVKAREKITSGTEWTIVSRIGEAVSLGSKENFEPVLARSGSFSRWWSAWKSHLFSEVLQSILHKIDPERTPSEAVSSFP